MAVADGFTAPRAFCFECSSNLIKLYIAFEDIEVFPKWSRTFIEFSNFSEFRKFDKSLKHELVVV